MRHKALNTFSKGKRPACLVLAGLMLVLSLGARPLPVCAEEAPGETAAEAVAETVTAESEAEEPMLTAAAEEAPALTAEAEEPTLTAAEAEEPTLAAAEEEPTLAAAAQEEPTLTAAEAEEPALTAAAEEESTQTAAETEEEPTLSAAARTDAFESVLASFPESYRPYLQQLHEAHPNWTFAPEYLGIDWDTAVFNESDFGESLVEGTSPASWKGTMDSVFRADSGTWVGLDGDRWVQASVAVTEYFMDPRVYLNDNGGIFAFLDHSYNENLASSYEAGLRQMLQGTAMSGSLQDDPNRSYVSVFLEAGRTYGVNPMVLAAMIMIEQGSGLGGLCVSGTIPGYEGYYNYFNVGAYARDGMSAQERGVWYASGQGSGLTSYGRPWNTRYASIMGGAMYYGQNYVDQGQDTLYYKRFNVGPSTSEDQRYHHQYMTNIEGCAHEAEKLSRAYDGQADLALNFVIPVYDNMPAAAPALPASNEIGSGDVSSSGRIVRTNSRFDPDVTRVVAEPLTAAYNTSYEIADGYIRGVAMGTNAGSLIQALGVQDGSVTVYNSLGTALRADQRLGSGFLVYLYNNAGEVQQGDALVLRGDLNGDGQISAIDLLRVQKGLLGVTQLAGAPYQAADINGDGQVSALDLLKIQKHLLGVSLIG